jgi:uroporphyrinogen decarboxylase
MNSRERFLTTINGKEPDRPPVIATVTPQVAKKLSDALGLPYEPPYDSMLSTRMSHMDLLTHLGNDAAGVAACAADDSPTIKLDNGLLTNEWGMIMKDIGLYGEFYDFPLKHAETKVDIDNYSFPDPFAKGRFRVARENIERYKPNFGVFGDLEISIYETAWYLTGMEKLLMDLMMEPEYLEPLLDRIMYINTETGKELIKLGVDMLWCGDDFGSQQGMIMDPSTWRKYFKTRIKTMFEEFRAINPDIKLAWHSCGSMIPIIPDFIEIGLDILNPIQPLAKDMAPEFLKKEFGKDLIFFGGICVQDLLPNGSVQQIKDEVKRRVEILGKGGGYIIAPAHNIQVDTSVENILAFFEAVKEL